MPASLAPTPASFDDVSEYRTSAAKIYMMALEKTNADASVASRGCGRLEKESDA
jgi:hypothetical protein